MRPHMIIILYDTVVLTLMPTFTRKTTVGSQQLKATRQLPQWWASRQYCGSAPGCIMRGDSGSIDIIAHGFNNNRIRVLF